MSTQTSKDSEQYCIEIEKVCSEFVKEIESSEGKLSEMMEAPQDDVESKIADICDIYEEQFSLITDVPYDDLDRTFLEVHVRECAILLKNFICELHRNDVLYPFLIKNTTVLKGISFILDRVLGMYHAYTMVGIVNGKQSLVFLPKTQFCFIVLLNCHYILLSWSNQSPSTRERYYLSYGKRYGDYSSVKDTIFRAPGTKAKRMAGWKAKYTSHVLKLLKYPNNIYGISEKFSFSPKTGSIIPANWNVGDGDNISTDQESPVSE